MMAAFNPAPKALYTIDELFQGYNPADPKTYADTLDFRIYREFVADGGAASTNKAAVRERAEHDCTILELLADRLSRDKVVAMMGGHAVARGSNAYRDTARAAALLTQAGFCVLSGGGPGAMDAAHLGAAVGDPGQKLDDALAKLAKGPTDISAMPVAYKPGAADPAPIDDTKLLQVAEYYRYGWEVRQEYPAGGGVAIPTWMYGWEPTTVFAADIGKYFQNSIREDGLLAAATHGIIFAEGSAGTLQEVFQDAAQNFYRSFPAPPEAGGGIFSPMVFLGDYWTSDPDADPTVPVPNRRKSLPVQHLLDMLWRKMRNGPAPADTLVTYASDPAAAVKAITDFKGLDVAPFVPMVKAAAV